MSNNYFEAYTKRCPHCGSTNFVGVPGVHFFKDRNFTCNNCKKGFEKPENVPNVTSGQSINYTTNAKNNGKTHSSNSETKKIGKKYGKNYYKDARRLINPARVFFLVTFYAPRIPIFVQP